MSAVGCWGRLHSILLTTGLLGLLGVPALYHINTVYRGELSYDRISAIPDQLPLPQLSVTVFSPTDTASALAIQIKDLIAKAPLTSPLIAVQPLTEQQLQQLELTSSAQMDALLTAMLDTLPARGHVNMFLIRGKSGSDECDLEVTMGPGHSGWFIYSPQCSTAHLALKIVHLAAHVSIPQRMNAQAPVVPLASKYEFVFSLLLEEDKGTVEWAIDEAIESTIRPLLNKLSSMIDVRVVTQILRGTSPAQPAASDNVGYYYTYENVAHQLLNVNQWSLGDAISTSPPVHFLLFVPKQSTQPLRLRDSNGMEGPAGFVAHEWGAMAILNSNTSVLTAKHLHAACELWHAAVRELLGISIIGNSHELSDVGWLQEQRTGVAAWELDLFARSRASEASSELHHTASAMVSMLERVTTLPVNDVVVQLMEQALKLHDEAISTIDRNGSMSHTTRCLSSALERASEAFHHPSMVSYLYFPEEHKIAVWAPYFVPVVLPLLQRLFMEFKVWRSDVKKCNDLINQ